MESRLCIKLEFPNIVKKWIEKPPKHFMESFKVLPKEQRVCAICTEEIVDDMGLTACYHFFHLKCIERVENKKCPTCRNQL